MSPEFWSIIAVGVTLLTVLGSGQFRLERRLERLEDRVNDLAERITRLEERFSRIEERMAHFEDRLNWRGV